MPSLSAGWSLSCPYLESRKCILSDSEKILVQPIAFTISMIYNNVCDYSSIAQLVEQSAVNRSVVGSSPTRGAILARWSRG